MSPANHISLGFPSLHFNNPGWARALPSDRSCSLLLLPLPTSSSPLPVSLWVSSWVFGGTPHRPSRPKVHGCWRLLCPSPLLCLQALPFPCISAIIQLSAERLCCSKPLISTNCLAVIKHSPHARYVLGVPGRLRMRDPEPQRPRHHAHEPLVP